MKTKIIYISGCEVFDPAEVRASFDEVRKMLNLSPDTIIFGVPVDADSIDVCAAPISVSTAENITAVCDNFIADVPVVCESVDVVSEEKPKPARRKKELKVKAEQVTEDIIEPALEPIVEKSHEPKPSSILSVLGAVKPAPEPEIVDDAPTEPVIETPIVMVSETIVETITMSENGDVERTTTIEDIFAELEPLKEDKIVNFMNGDEDDEAQSADDIETDATLTQMANEFAATHDEIIDVPKSGSGKIGKLKNILPFKKAKKDESSVLGDLFGWAGIAANDDEEKFQMPSWALGNN